MKMMLTVLMMNALKPEDRLGLIEGLTSWC